MMLSRKLIVRKSTLQTTNNFFFVNHMPCAVFRGGPCCLTASQRRRSEISSLPSSLIRLFSLGPTLQKPQDSYDMEGKFSDPRKIIGSVITSMLKFWVTITET